MIVALFTGSREWKDKAAVVAAFEHAEQVGIHYVVTGDQRGLDRLAYEVARERGHGQTVVPVHAFWNEDGRGAGNVRNRQMINTALVLASSLSWIHWARTRTEPNLRPYAEFVHGYAFPMPGSIGTWNCCDDMKAAHINYDLRGTSPRRGA